MTIFRLFLFQIATDFCSWLRDLPNGEDDTVNTMPEEHIRALFDTGQAANTGISLKTHRFIKLNISNVFS